MSTGGPVSTWYTNSYSGPFRSSRLRSHSLLAAASRPMPQQTLVVDAATRNAGNAGGGAAAGNGDKEDKSQVRRRETIFGPDVGEDDEPGWTKPEDGVKVSVDTVKGWVERVKGEEGLHATTTLQALVNLKRPTLLLQQLEHEQPGSASSTEIEPKPLAAEVADPYHHGPPVHILKFNYDAMTPRVNITLSIYPTPVSAAAAEEEGAKSVIEEDVKVIYSGTHAGGFNQLFTLPSHAAIDLSSAIAPMPAPGEEQDLADLQDKKDGDMSQGGGSGGASGAVRESEDTTRSSFDRNNMMLHRNSTTGALQTVPELGGQDGGVPPTIPENGEARTNTGRRRFGLFGRRDRERDAEQGQIEMSAQGNSAEGEGGDAAPKEPERGMRLLIKIEAISDEGQGLSRRNAQLTHILINGMWASDGTSPTGKRVWLVKVVRREAVIGAHTFLLKEIYGLSSSQAAQSASYPPAAGAAEDPYASTPNECIVCLTSPRDVVLLPCRHLVVCRDCAVGMVEFGAGGKVARREGDASGDVAAGGDASAGGVAGAAGGANASAGGAAAPPVAGGTTERGRERRKKKAKGWYCPVCRQPYTSLLRLALPASAKPLRTPGASRMPSRAPSIRSHHTTHAHDGETNSLRRVPSIAPTLPDGAERMLEALRPEGADDDESEEDDVAHDHDHAHAVERPQFVLGEEVDTAEHAHVQLPSTTTTTAPALAPVASAPGDKDKAEVEHNESIEHGMQDVSLNDEPVAKHEAKH